jgi:hypothetical protein
MLLRGAFGEGEGATACSLLIDTALAFPLALDTAGWKKAGIDTATLKTTQNSGPYKLGVLPNLRLGAFDVPQVPGLQSDSSIKEREDGLGVELDGLLGSGLLATFRMTLIDSGRTMWLEDTPLLDLPLPETIERPDVPDSDVSDEDEADEPPAGKPGAGKTAPKKAPATSAKPAPGSGAKP